MLVGEGDDALVVCFVFAAPGAFFAVLGAVGGDMQVPSSSSGSLVWVWAARARTRSSRGAWRARMVMLCWTQRSTLCADTP